MIRNTYLLYLKGEESDEGQTVELDGNLLTKDNIKQIQKDIKSTIRPTWQAPPPSNFGSPSHGKPKADVWRTCIEFDLTVSLARCGLNHLQPSGKNWLARAIQFGTSYRTSSPHGEHYTEKMETYLKSIMILRPDQKLRPIHHNALHFPEFLLRFGPSHGWWMFPFERLIGKLQKIHTNNKLGEHQAPLSNSSTHNENEKESGNGQ